ncbi:MAG: hypothetical protein A3B81_01465 [Candidatus Muproteobacteria bacterium RIFCSPHIGHO2_02_FULL_65_16]|uniref:SAM-dependent chlorinase/fluorinase n=1 Tax=Candidatus Muproteobacteria bacterium RIFCSPHIGHO2_02_FULL_65_16 TaxID=1817766 RepID=A0A1F6U398_9PROT|nr:MAG: hypothetical protein A3B81_01465 [Candidatus Muproteobacteria bacterium RIFCSPHIGHO2_02_FULL_65_16]
MIALFTDFGLVDPYVGQMHAALARAAPGIPVIDLFHAVPDFDIRAGAYLLPAYVNEFPEGTVFVCVVDPGVGGARRPVLVQADGRRYVGPDNGLFHILARRAGAHECREILWRPEKLSASFHGRDLFAPAAARLACGEAPESAPTTLTAPEGEWPDDLPVVIYIDHYGNAVTGLRAEKIGPDATLKTGRRAVKYARVFDAVAPGKAFWYENANGLVEIAVNQGSAARALGLKLGQRLASA